MGVAPSDRLNLYNPVGWIRYRVRVLYLPGVWASEAFDHTPLATCSFAVIIQHPLLARIFHTPSRLRDHLFQRGVHPGPGTTTAKWLCLQWVISAHSRRLESNLLIVVVMVVVAICYGYCKSVISIVSCRHAWVTSMHSSLTFSQELTW